VAISEPEHGRGSSVRATPRPLDCGKLEHDLATLLNLWSEGVDRAHCGNTAPVSWDPNTTTRLGVSEGVAGTNVHLLRTSRTPESPAAECWLVLSLPGTGQSSAAGVRAGYLAFLPDGPYSGSRPRAGRLRGGGKVSRLHPGPHKGGH